MIYRSLTFFSIASNLSLRKLTEVVKSSSVLRIGAKFLSKSESRFSIVISPILRYKHRAQVDFNTFSKMKKNMKTSSMNNIQNCRWWVLVKNTRPSCLPTQSSKNKKTRFLCISLRLNGIYNFQLTPVRQLAFAGLQLEYPKASIGLA